MLRWRRERRREKRAAGCKLTACLEIKTEKLYERNK